MFSKIILFVFVGILVMSVAVLAATITTSVRFLIPTDTAFSMAVPSNNATFVTGSTQQILFNSSSTTVTKINASIAGNTTAQNEGIAIFRYRNDGNVPLNITFGFDAITSSCITVKAGNQSSSYEATCSRLNGPPNSTACVNWNSTSYGAKNVTNGLATTATDDVWLWADFTSCTAGLDETDTVTHTSLR